MTIAEVKEMFKGEYYDVEVYEPRSWGAFAPNRFHTDNCRYVDSANDSREVRLWELMGEEDYHNSIEANSCVQTDFADCYGDESAKVLCIMLSSPAEEVQND